MQDPSAILGGLGAIALVAAFVLAVLTILMPVMIYSGQKSAYRCLKELKKLNGTVTQLLEESESQRMALLQVVTAEKPASQVRAEQ